MLICFVISVITFLDFKIITGQISGSRYVPPAFDGSVSYNDIAQMCCFYYATIAYHVGLNAVLGLPHPGPTS